MMGWFKRILGLEKPSASIARLPEITVPQAVEAADPSRARREGWQIPPPPLPMKANNRAPRAPQAAKTTLAKADNGRRVTWYPRGAATQIGDFDLKEGMLYLGWSSSDTYGADATHSCLVDPFLKIGAPGSKPREEIGYWPSYASLSPSNRRSYLQWLAGGRADPSASIGFVFLFFYGLERRLLIDKPLAVERDLLVAEIHRLRGIYTQSSSFAGYSASLLREVHLRETLQNAKWMDTWKPDPRGDCEAVAPLLRIYAGKLVAAGQALPFELALACVIAMPSHQGGIGRGKVVTRYLDVFVQLMQQRFAAKFPNGLKLRDKAGSKLMLGYRAAASNTNVPPVDLGQRIPDPWDLTWTKLTDICSAAASELAAYARAVGGDPAKVESAEALAALPDDLIAARYGCLKAFGEWLDGLPPVTSVDTCELWGWFGGEGSPTPKQWKLVASILEPLGAGIEPDPACSKQSLGRTTVVLRFPKSISGSRAGSGQLDCARLAGAFFTAARDGKPASTDILDLLTRGLDPIARLRVEAQLEIAKTTDTSLADVRKAAQVIQQSHAPQAAALVREVAVAIGANSPKKVGIIEVVHEVLKQDRAAIYTSLHRVGLGRGAAPLSLGSGQHRDNPMAAARVASALDLDAIKRIRAETQGVSALLTQVWDSSEQPEAVATKTAHSDQADPATIDGLDAAHSGLLTDLTRTAEWSRRDFEALARTHGLMPDAAAETLNDWGFDRFDELLIEDIGDTLVIAVHLPLTKEAA